MRYLIDKEDLIGCLSEIVCPDDGECRTRAERDAKELEDCLQCHLQNGTVEEEQEPTVAGVASDMIARNKATEFTQCLEMLCKMFGVCLTAEPEDECPFASLRVWQDKQDVVAPLGQACWMRFYDGEGKELKWN